MKLKTWMKLNGKTYREMAEALNIHHTTLFYYNNKKRAMPLKIAVKIEKYTGEEVKCKDLV